MLSYAIKLPQFFGLLSMEFELFCPKEVRKPGKEQGTLSENWFNVSKCSRYIYRLKTAETVSWDMNHT